MRMIVINMFKLGKLIFILYFSFGCRIYLWFLEYIFDFFFKLRVFGFFYFYIWSSKNKGGDYNKKIFNDISFYKWCSRSIIVGEICNCIKDCCYYYYFFYYVY